MRSSHVSPRPTTVNHCISILLIAWVLRSNISVARMANLLRRQDSEPRNTKLPSLSRAISPPPTPRKRRRLNDDKSSDASRKTRALSQPSLKLAAIEAGEVEIRNHLDHFSTSLSRVARQSGPSQPRISIKDFQNLYKRNQHADGRHFVVHQHDHPVAGVHYDLRLQISATSSISFAIMYGLPGNPNSKRLNRNAAETRVHNLWVGRFHTPIDHVD